MLMTLCVVPGQRVHSSRPTAKSALGLGPRPGDGDGDGDVAM